MTSDLFSRVDSYIDGLFVGEDIVLREVLSVTANAGLPDIQISPNQGKLLYLLAKLVGARRILEIGTLAGYSAIWMARALPPDGRLVTLEVDSKHAYVARSCLMIAGVARGVDVREGPALETLAQLEAQGDGPFDLVFIDADKANYPAYLKAVLALVRPGSLIVADNVVRGGNVLAPEDDAARGTAEFNAAIAAEPRLEATIIQLVGSKGHDGLALARVLA